MLASAIVSFREFFEAFLIVGIFLSVSKKLGLKREVEITLAAALGMVLALTLIGGAFFLSQDLKAYLSEENAHLFESGMQIFSAFFIAYVVFALHDIMEAARKNRIAGIKEKLEANVFDISLFLLIVFMVAREGFEVAVVNATVSLFSSFADVLKGILTGFFVAAAVGISSYFALVRLPIEKIFRAVSFIVIAAGAWFFQSGVTGIAFLQFNTDFNAILPTPGIPFNFISIGIMGLYAAVIYRFFVAQNARAR